MTKILMIDDDPDDVLAARLCLEKEGYEVLEAKNGKEGLDVMREDRPELVILDVMMDTATEGFQLALKLRSQDPQSELKEFSDIPILMLTAIHSTTPLRFEPDIEYLPIELFVDKPIDPDDLVGKVAWILGKDM